MGSGGRRSCNQIVLWLTFSSGPYLGPFMASFAVWGLGWRWVYWIYAMLNYVSFILFLAFGDETFNDRRVPPEQQPAWKSRPLRLLGVEKHGTCNLVESCSRPFIAFAKLPVVIITVYYFLNFAWTIGVNATLATWLAQYYHFNGMQTGEIPVLPIIPGTPETDRSRPLLLCPSCRMHYWCNQWPLVAR